MSYNNNRRRNNYNNRRQNNVDDHKYDSSKRTINSLLSFDDNIEYEEDVKRNGHNDNKQESKRDWDNSNNNKNVSNNPLFNIISSNGAYDRQDVINILVKKNGLADLIDDLKKAKKKNIKKPFYISMLFRDIVFASALPEAIDKLIKKDEFGETKISKKDINVLLDEILTFLSNSYDNKLIQKYGEESVESMRKAYTNILYRFNKK